MLDDNNDAGTPPLPALLPGLATTTSPLSALLSSASQSSCSSYWSLEEITMSAAPNACNDNASNDTLILAKPCPWWCAQFCQCVAFTRHAKVKRTNWVNNILNA